jgi:hypothetical protein
MKKTATSRALAAIETSKLAEPEKNRRRVAAIFDGIRKDGISPDPKEAPEPPPPSLDDARRAIRFGDLAEETDVKLTRAKAIVDVLGDCPGLEDHERGTAWAVSALIKEALNSLDSAHREIVKFLPRATMEQRQAIREEQDHEAA